MDNFSSFGVNYLQYPQLGENTYTKVYGITLIFSLKFLLSRLGIGVAMPIKKTMSIKTKVNMFVIDDDY